MRWGTWNVGKRLRHISPGLAKEIAISFDIICLQEIAVRKTADFFKVLSPLLKSTFKWIVQPRPRLHRDATSASGGVAMGIRMEYANDVTQVKTEKECYGVQIIRMPGTNIGLDKDLYLFNVYNPPSSTPYADIRAAPDRGAADILPYLLKETVRYKKEGYVAMMGDFNAHTADQDEGYGDVDEDIFSFIQEGGAVPEDCVQTLRDIREEGGAGADVFASRVSECMHECDDTGEFLLQLCLVARLVILNGRFGLSSRRVTCLSSSSGTVVDYMCIDNRLARNVFDCRILDDICMYNGDRWSSVSDHLPVCIDVPWGLSARHTREVFDRLDRALSHQTCLANLDTWRGAAYSQQWTIRWSAKRANRFHECINEWVRREDVKDLCKLSYNDTCEVSRDTWYEQHTCVLLASLNEWMWDAADEAGLVCKQFCPLQYDTWGKSHVTIPVDQHVILEDTLWLDQGKIPRRLWWDSTCESIKRDARVAENTYRTWQKSVVNSCILDPEAKASAKAEADARRKVYMERVRALRMIERTKEHECRIERRNRLLNERGSKSFWKQVAQIDAEHIAKRLLDVSTSSSTSPSLDTFADHFRSIACPPSCTWFNDSFRDLVTSVVNLSLRDVDNVKCDWSLDGSDLRAFVQSMITEVDRAQWGMHIDSQVCTQELHNARVALNARITVEELRAAKRRMNTGKAVGLDGIPFELFRGMYTDDVDTRNLVSSFDELILHMFNSILVSGRYPDAWRLAVLVPLLKGVDLDTLLPTNYRGIALMSCMSKLFANILEHRLTNFQTVTGIISAEQFGFTRGRRTLDPIFILDTLIDKAKVDGRELYVTFIDFQKAYDFVFLDGLFYKMLRSNMIGPVYRVLHSMYESVCSVVRQGSAFSDVIHQHVGLRQGCILSPCLFSLFIADFPQFLRDQGCLGVPLHDAFVNVLFYADDGAFVSHDVKEMQRMLDALRVYCSKWRMFVNTGKTKVMVFNQVANTKPVLMYDGIELGIVRDFKYLGVLFSIHNTRGNSRYGASVEHRLKQAKRLVAAWMRRCEIWHFKPDIVINQFNTCVMPALEYGVGLWGVGLYKSDSWKQVETFWRYIARCILGVSQRAPNGGVYGDLGWFPFHVRAAWQATSMWTRITEMPDSSLTRKAMYVQRDMLSKGKECWLNSFKSTLLSMSTCGHSFWNQWWSNCHFRVTCSRLELNDCGINTVRWETDCLASFREHAIHEWSKDVTRINAKCGQGLNKLRTYALFKRQWKLEPYLTCIDDRDKRVLLTKFRIGICPLRIETGRYEQVSKNIRGLPEVKRTCKCCVNDMVENEYHFLLICPAYERERKHLFEVVRNKFSMSHADIDSSIFDIKNLFTRIMESDDSDIINAIADFLDKAFYKRERLLL